MGDLFNVGDPVTVVRNIGLGGTDFIGRAGRIYADISEGESNLIYTVQFGSGSDAVLVGLFGAQLDRCVLDELADVVDGRPEKTVAQTDYIEAVNDYARKRAKKRTT